MAGLEIGLVVIGILIFIGSFFVTEKLSSSDMKEITKISEKEIKNIVNKAIAESDDVIKTRFDNKLNDAVNDFDIRTDDEYVNKMNQMNEYSEKVLETMEKTHNEIVFIYSMLNDKQENVKDLTSKLDTTKSQLLQLKSDVDLSIKELNEQYEQNIKLKKEQEFVTGLEAVRVKTETVKTFEDELIERISDEDEEVPEGYKEAMKVAVTNTDVSKSDSNESDSDNNEPNIEIESNSSSVENEIVKLYKEGYSEVEIARKLGKGIGEIKLVLGLYN